MVQCPQVDIVIPVYNEEESLPELFDKIAVSLSELRCPEFKVIFVNDGSTDRSWAVIAELKSKHPDHILGINLRRNRGKAFALDVGFHHTSAPVVVTMDADLQDDPRELGRFFETLDDGFDLVNGWKEVRNDPLDKTLPSKIFNGLVSMLTGIKLHDFNCGFKCYRGEVARNLNLYGELHRFTPVLAHYYGFRITEISITHHSRKYGHSKYGFERFLRGIIDLITVVSFTRFSDRPAHLFGGWGILSGVLGVSFLLYLTMLKLVLGEFIGGRPLLFLGILLVTLSIQLLSLGIIAELILRKSKFSPVRDIYISKILD